MTCNTECTQFDLAMELLIAHGFEGIADCIAILMNSAMQLERSRHLNAEHYERTAKARMNGLIIAGILVIALGGGVGSYLIYLGNAKNDDTSKNEIIGKIDEAQEQIAKLKERSDQGEEVQEEVNQIEEDIVKWAEEFNSTKAAKKIEHKKAALNTSEEHIAVSDALMPSIKMFFNTLTDTVSS